MKYKIMSRISPGILSLVLTLYGITGITLSCLGQAEDSANFAVVMREGVVMMDTGNYRGADEKFKIVLRNENVLPSDICYFFGKNSYFLSEFKQSINWLSKYIELKGTTGQYFQDCNDYLTRAEKAYTIQQDSNNVKVREELSKPTDFNCNGKTYIKCPICQGEGVLIKPGKLGSIYQTCPFCRGDGKVLCEDYKKYLRGELILND